MKFQGDILITDPCYIIRDGNGGFAEGLTEDDWEESDYGQDLEKLGISNYITEDSGGDGSWKIYQCSDPDKALKEIDELQIKIESYDYKTQEKEYHAALDAMDEYLDGFTCLGHFCADSGTSSVLAMDEVDKYNPKVRDWVKAHDWCATILSDFDGEIEEVKLSAHSKTWPHLTYLHFIGKGNINFFTA